MNPPARGQVWTADLNPVRGHEQAGHRPCIVVSIDQFNRGPADLVVIIPLTSRYRPLPLRVVIEPPEGGLSVRSVALVEHLRSISNDRLGSPWGVLLEGTMRLLEDRIRILLGL